jgi:UDP-2-acetamido-3-amino-2,3-dideoxy-glucuronate N-acetyltransferase
MNSTTVPNYFKHTLSDVASATIGDGSTIWQYVVILKDAKIGVNCNVCANCFIENDVKIGDNVTIKSGVQIWDGMEIGDNVFIGPNATFSNDNFPRSKNKPAEFLKTIIQSGASIGAGSIILPGITIGSNAMIGAGSVVTRAVPANAIVYGNPARIVGYVNAAQTKSEADRPERIFSTGANSTRVNGVAIYKLPEIIDIRGNLSVGEFEKSIPFAVKRYFLIYAVPSVETRGEHAHHACHQFLICVKGQCSVVADDGIVREEIVLNSPAVGLHLPPLTWGIQYKYSPDAVLLVFASHLYDAGDYIRSYSEFVQLKGAA